MRWVVVGAGSGGCVAARRLHDAGHEVVLVEAGPPLEPGAVPSGIDGSDSFAALDEPGRVYADLFALRSKGQVPRQYLRGRGVGGSSAVNSMIALHGDDALYRSWGWDDVEEAAGRVLVPRESPSLDEVGRVDRLLLRASSRASIAPLTRSGGRRITTAEAYVWPIVSSPRFQIVTDEVVDVVTFDSARSARGVRLASATEVDADAVVLAAGAIHTPTILLRSAVDAPGVGRGLQDHPSAALTLRLRAPSTSEMAGRVAAHLATASYVDLDPIQLLPLNHLGVTAPGELAMMLVALMRPHGASGVVRLGGSSPNDQPIVDFDLLSDQRDVEVLRSGVRLAIDLLSRQPFDDAVDAIYIDDRGTTIDALDTDADIDRWLTAHTAEYVHASSSCAQSVDVDGGVLGHPGLYICDASVFPSIPNVNPHLPTMMLAERLSARWPGMAGSRP